METATNESTLKENVADVPSGNLTEKDILVWTAPSRAFKKRDKQFYVTTISITALVSLILFLAEGAMPVVLIISLVFLYYVLNSVPPDQVEYKITSKGIKISQTVTFPWQDLTRFWFIKRYEQDVLVFETRIVPNRLEMLVRPELVDNCRKELQKFLPEETPNPSSMDKLIDWFSKKLPQ